MGGCCCDTAPRLQAPRIDVQENARTTPRSRMVMMQRHRGRLVGEGGGFGLRDRRRHGAQMARALSQRGRPGGPLFAAAFLPFPTCWRRRCRDRGPVAPAAVRSGDCETPRPCGLDGRQGTAAIEAGTPQGTPSACAGHPLRARKTRRADPSRPTRLEQPKPPVSVGRMEAAVAEIIDGLSAGDAVVVRPSDTLADGSLIERRLEGEWQLWSSTGRADASCAELRCNPRRLHASWKSGRRDCVARLSS